MIRLTRRHFGGILLAGTQARGLFGASASIDDTLREGLRRRGIPCVVAMAADTHHTFYSGAFGRRDGDSETPVALDTIFSIASMTKPITSVAAMQLVEQGKITLDEPVARVLPQLGGVQVLTGFDAAGKPMLRPARNPMTLRHLLTHTSGFAYSVWHEQMFKYVQTTGPIPNSVVAPLVPLMFDPGTNWQYGYSADWTGRVVEAISGMNLEQYFQKNILEPLGMKDTGFIFDNSKFDRLAGVFQRTPDGKFQAVPRMPPAPPADYNGGGGLYSTAGDYVRFMQMILRRGLVGPKTEILKGQTVDLMMENQIGNLTAGKLKSFSPNVSSDVDTAPGGADKWGLGFLINPERHPGGRQPGSLAWAGIYNTYFWIDPRRGVSGVIMMQYLPFYDVEAIGLLNEFEQSVYAHI